VGRNGLAVISRNGSKVESKAGGKVRLIEEGGRLVISPGSDNSIAAATGFLTGKFSLTDDLRHEHQEEKRREQQTRSR
jgi:hypothetical protein